MSAPTAPAAALERPSLPMRFIYLIALIELLVDAVVIAPLVISLSLKVLQLQPVLPAGLTKEGALATVTAVGALAALVVTPMFGYWSDRTRSRFGRRRPWVIAGAALLVPTSAVMAFAGDVFTLMAGWALVTIAASMSLAALFGWIADLVPDHQRAKASGIFGAGNIAGLVPALVIAAAFKNDLVLAFMVMPVVAAVATLLIARFIPDASTAHAALAPARLIGVFASLLFNPAKHRQFALVWLQRFLIQFGYMLFGTFGLYYLMERMAMDAGGATTTTSMASLLTGVLSMIAAFAFGFIAAKRRDYTPFVIVAIAGVAVACFLKAFTGDLGWFWVGSGLSGFALGCFYAVDMALVLRTIPADENARFLGVFNIAKTLPQSLAPALAPAFLLIGGKDPIHGGENNYAALFTIAGVFALLSLLPLAWTTALRRPVAQAETFAAVDAPAGTAPHPAAAPGESRRPSPTLTNGAAR
ncbi:MFS transporter [Microbacterium sp. Au-Mic1]|uniref:MFS transporter n=1 Tax=Microbacterium sp. Au-Mic1 TaxID=2906457 RepID=UPI001E5DBD8E|nr:MFS transporter [Microbacterium sp. Au-Mic1]MCE4026565.1 MFS transporter [Microbacterium sp. Au-Mic1]